MDKTWQKWLAKRFQFSQQKQLSQKDVLIFIYRQGYLYLVLILITFVAGVNYANNLILGFCFLISAVLCVSFYLTFKQLHDLKIELIADDVGQVGQSLNLHIYFHQQQIRPRYLYIKAGDQLAKVYLDAARQQFILPFYAEHRGKFDYPVIRIYSVYPFGLVRAWTYLYHQHSAWIAPKAEVFTTENKYYLNRFELDMDEFRELRNYQSGDSLQSVSWKQFARGQGLYVKVFEQYQDKHSIEIHYEHMPTQSHEEKLEFMMGLVEQCGQQQCAYALHLPQAELPQGAGEEQLRKAKQLLAQA
ncbi:MULTISPECIES: DUF58 domain-containing protein [unclassified Acinetobacter]|uniref:DUF58 domain-containing protein n=1 Tax=unclassified Acinetobacter TaxID=196816 RepID=UPI001C217842|nr:MULTISPECIES: DUF58 domain-containing protein [unclassified Acinetobacter]